MPSFTLFRSGAARGSKPMALIALFMVTLSCAHLVAADDAGDPAVQFQLADPDLIVELVAAEPLIVDPVAMAFDARGRLFVVEMRGFQQGPDAKGIPGLGRVRMLEDRDGDGVFDSATTFTDGLYYATAIMPVHGGVLVGCAPDLLFYSDTNGDGVAEMRHTLFTGFGTGNHEQLVNTFQWGLDNWVHACSGGNGGTITTPAGGMAPVNVSGRNLRLRPITGPVSDEPWQPAPGKVRVETTSGPGQFGLTANDFGDYFTCDNSHHIRHIVLPDDALRRNPRLVVPRTFLDIADHGAACRIQRISPMEHWRVVRTQQRAAAPDASRFPATELVPGGYITAACSITFFDGDGLGDGYVGNTFVCDAANNLIHRDRLEPNGATYVARRVEPEAEFLASRNNWFRPTALAVGPDGCLYVADMRREIIETPASIPPEILRTIDLDAGEDQGRIWRVRRRGSSAARRPVVNSPGDVRQPDHAELVTRLADANGWSRRMARQLLVEHRARDAAPLLAAMVLEHAKPLARLNALSTLDGIGVLEPPILRKGLEDADPHVRVQAIRLTGAMFAGSAERPVRFAAGDVSGDELLADLLRLATDPVPRVRFELALQAAHLPARQRVQVLVQLAAADSGDEWMRAALLSSASGAEEWFWKSLLTGPSPPLGKSSPGSILLVRELAALIAAQADTDALAEVVSGLPGGDEASIPWWHADAIQGIARGLGLRPASERPPGSSAGGPSVLGEAVLELMERSPPGPPRQAARSLLASLRWTATPARLQRLIDTEAELAGDPDQPVEERVSAANMLILDHDRAVERLTALLAPYEPAEVQLAAIHALGSTASGPAAAALLDRGRWRMYTPRLQSAVLDAVLSQKAMWPGLLTSIGAGDVPAWSIDAARRERLLASTDPAIRERAASLLNPEGDDTRREVYDRYRGTLNASGDPSRGREVFKTNCSACHQLEGIGQVVGPDLQPLRTRPPEALLSDILMPSVTITAGYNYYAVDTAEGESLTGVIASETPNAITLRQREGVEHVILREEIDDLYASSVSMMPENFDHLITPAQMNDLLAFLHQPGGVNHGGTEITEKRKQE